MTGLIDLGCDVRIIAFNRSKEIKQHPAITQYGLLKRTTFLTQPNTKTQKRADALAKLVYTGLKHPYRLRQLLAALKLNTSCFSYSDFHLGTALINENADIVHCHYGPMGMRALFSKKIGLNAKLSTVFHGYDLSAYLNQYGPAVYEELFESGDLFLPISDFWKKKLISLGCPENKIVVNHMGIDTQQFQTLPQEKPNKTIKILTIARLTEKKGHRYALEAIKTVLNQVPNLEYHIAGDGPLLDDIKARVSGLGIEEHVTFHGQVNATEALDLYKNTDIFLLPSVTSSKGDMEGIPIVLMEAMACQKPVVTTQHSGIPELVMHQKTGFTVPEKNPEAIAKIIIELAGNEPLRIKVGQNAQAFIKENFNTNLLLKELHNLFISLSMPRFGSI